MQVRLIRRGRPAQQPRLFADRVARDVDVEIHERARPHALRLRQHREVGHADVEHEEATRTEQAVRGSPCVAPIVEHEQVRDRAAGDDDRVERFARAGPVVHVASHERYAVALRTIPRP